MNSYEILERKKTKNKNNNSDYSDSVISAYVDIIATGPRSAAPYRYLPVLVRLYLLPAQREGPPNNLAQVPHPEARPGHFSRRWGSRPRVPAACSCYHFWTWEVLFVRAPACSPTVAASTSSLDDEQRRDPRA